MALLGTETTPFLVCFDFDKTITMNSSHNYLYEFFQTTFSDEIDITTIRHCIETCGFKNRDLTRIAIQTALKNGHKVAITTANEFPFIIPFFLEALGLSKDDISKIKIISGRIEEKAPRLRLGKQIHIQEAIKWAQKEGWEPSNEKVILIDDADINIEIAIQNKHIAIPVEKSQLDPHYEYKSHLLSLIPYIGEFDLPSYTAPSRSSSSSSSRNIDEKFIKEIESLLIFRIKTSCISYRQPTHGFLIDMLYRHQAAELDRLKHFVAQCKKYYDKNLDQPIPVAQILQKTIEQNDFLLRRMILEKWDKIKEENKAEDKMEDKMKFS